MNNLNETGIIIAGYRTWALNAANRIIELFPELSIQVATSPDELTELVECPKSEKPILYLVGWSWILRPEELGKTQHTFCLHPSDLPNYAGGSPIQHQIIDGIESTLLSLFLVTNELDSGPVVSQVGLSLKGVVSDIFLRLEKQTVQLLAAHIRNCLELGSFEFQHKNHCCTVGAPADKVTRKRLKPESGRLTPHDFATKSSRSLFNHIRCRTDPYPNAYIEDQYGRLLLTNVSYIEKDSRGSNERNSDVVVLGARGMLGHACVKYFGKKNYNVTAYTSKLDLNGLYRLTDELNRLDSSIIINCIGAIRQKYSDPGALYFANTIIPLVLSERLNLRHKLVHPSTDCVFSGKAVRAYRVSDSPDCTDHYGLSKLYGEQAARKRPNTLVLRGSLIGPEVGSEAHGLLGWLLSRASSEEIDGYTDHFWNGVTTLEWCEKVENLIDNFPSIGTESAAFAHVGTPDSISKYELLKLCVGVFDLPNRVRPKSVGTISRVLVPTIECQPILHQLNKLKSWMRTEL